VSTHIMPEVEAVCGRVVLIAGGRIVIDETLERLHTEKAVVLEVRGPADAARKALEAAPGVARVVVGRRDGEHTTFEVQARRGADLREELARRVVQNGWGLRALEVRR